MNSDISDYIHSLQGQFVVQRKLTDGTLVTGFVPEEELALMEFIGAFSRQRRSGGRLATWVEFPAEVNAYKTILLGWWGLLEADAEATQKTLLWVTTTGAMEAKAQMHVVSLGLLRPFDCVTWGDLVTLARDKPALLSQVIILGDVDFEPGNSVQRLLNSDGSIGHDEVLAGVRRLAGSPQVDMVLFHRAGWVAGFDPEAMLTGAQAVASPLQASEKEDFDKGQVIMSARVCGLLFLLPLACNLVSKEAVEWDLGLLWPLAGLVMVVWGFTAKLPKK